MNKAWITALSIAGIAGSAGAAYTGLSADANDGGPVEAQGLPAAPVTTLAAIPTPVGSPTADPATATYQVGAAGTVTVVNTNGVVSVQSAMPSPGWTVLGYTSPAGHVEVRFANPLQTVTFNADVVDGTMVASLAEAPTAPTIEVPTTAAPAEAPTTAPAPQPATPVAAPAAPVTSPQETHSTTPAAPSHAATTAPSSHSSQSASSGGGSSHDDDSDDEGDYENEEEDD